MRHQALLFLLLLNSAVYAEKWTNTDGNTIQAKFIRIDGTSVVLLKQGKEFKYPISKLDDASKALAKKLSEAEQPAVQEKASPETERGTPKLGGVSADELRFYMQALDSHLEWRKKAQTQKLNPFPGSFLDAYTHQILSTIQRDLALLASKEVYFTGSSSLDERTKSKIKELRQQILEKEHERIQMVVKETPTRFPIQIPNLDRELYDLELELDTIFEKKVEGPKKKIEKELRKALQKELDSAFPKQDEIARIRAELESHCKSLDVEFMEVYGYERGNLLGVRYGGSTDASLSEFMTKVDSTRLEIAGERPVEDNEKKQDKKIGSIAGIEISSRDLGVVLDISGSMTPFIPKLKREIERVFDAPEYKEVVGCSLTTGIPLPATNIEGNGWTYFHTLKVIEGLIVNQRVDTVFWYCDLKDRQDVYALRRLRFLLRTFDVVLHVKSEGRKPRYPLEPLVTR